MKRTCKVKKNTLSKLNETKKLKMPLSPLRYSHLLQGMGSPLKSGRFPSETPLERSHFSFVSSYQLEIDAGDLRPLLSALGLYLVQTRAGPVHAATVSLSSYVPWSYCIWKALFSLVSSSLTGSNNPSPLSWGFLIPEGRDLVKVSHLGLSLLTFPTLCTLSSCATPFQPVLC